MPLLQDLQYRAPDESGCTGNGYAVADHESSPPNLKARCRARTASCTRSPSITQVMRIPEVEIMSILMPRSPSVPNMIEAYSRLDERPAPTTDTLANPPLTVTLCASTFSRTSSAASLAASISDSGTVNERSVRP